jgi:hypothetical protein
VPKYTLEIKASAQKELDALEHGVFARIDRKILTLAGNPRPEGCKKLKSYNAFVAHPRGWLARGVLNR